MKKLTALIALSLMAAPIVSFAQDGTSCATPIVAPFATPINTDTTGMPNSIGSFGPLPSPSNDAIYTFTFPTGGTQGGQATVTASSYSMAIYLLTSCTNGASPAPIADWVGTGAGGFTMPALTEGTAYYIVISGDPTGGPGANGTSTWELDNLPVTLQNFQID